MTLAKGTKSGKQLRGYIEEIEGVRERKKQLGEAEKAIFAEAKAQGFDTKTIRALVKLREMDPVKVREAQGLLDTYMHAIGMEDEPPPLFAALARAGADPATREEAVEFMKTIVPTGGEIVLKVGGTPVRIFRDADGEAHAEDATVERVAPTTPTDDDDVTSTYGPSGPARVARKSHVDEVVERAERSSREKREREAKAPA